MTFKERYFSHYILTTDQFSLQIPLLLQILGNNCVVIIFYSVCDIIKFEINHNFLIKPLFYTAKKSLQKFKYLKNKKSFLHEIKSIFPSMGFQLSEIVSDPRVDL